jgi:hypothetical protein
LASIWIEQFDTAFAIGVRSSDGRIYEVGTASTGADSDFGIAVFTP